MKPVLLFLTVIAFGAVSLAPAVSLAQPKPAQKSALGGIGQTFKDSWITSKTKMAMLGDKRVSSFDIKVKTQRGVVMLRGKVDSAEERSAAERIARGIDGVRSVSNLLQVVPRTQRKAAEAWGRRAQEGGPRMPGRESAAQER
jgi:hypothetical protein